MSKMHTHTGGVFDLQNPVPGMVNIADIAHALSLTCRYGGHCKQFYSVAEHCVWISRALPKQAKLHGLLHDAAEAYIGDMIHPLKQGMPRFSALERQIMKCVYARFRLPNPTEVQESLVKAADHRAAVWEYQHLMTPSGRAHDEVWAAYVEGVPPLYGKQAPECWMPTEAERLFVQEFNTLMIGDL